MLERFDQFFVLGKVALPSSRMVRSSKLIFSLGWIVFLRRWILLFGITHLFDVGTLQWFIYLFVRVKTVLGL